MHMRMMVQTAGAILFGAILLAGRPAAAAPDRFLHVEVTESNKSGDNVNVNLPLQLAEKVLPTIDRGPLHQGRVTIPHDSLQGIDLHTMLDAVRNSPDGNFVTAKQGTENISVVKSKGSLVVHVKDSQARGETVDVVVPLSMVDALFNNVKADELDVAGALQALDSAGDTLMVTVQDASNHVRVWIDSNNQPQ
jgi:hypothetical protein